VHEHVEEFAPRLDQLAADLRRELSRTRADVAADTDTIAELAFTLERFADLFAMRMEELARQFGLTAGASASALRSSIVELPFAFAAAAVLEPGATIATVSDDGRLSIGLAARGLHVTALEPTTSVAHPDVTVASERVGEWGGPAEALDAVFALAGAPNPAAAETRPLRERVDAFHKWIRPAGLLVLGTWIGPGQGTTSEDVNDLLADWDVERRERFAQDVGGAWRRSEDESAVALELIEAAPRP
jgi:hypothetical protein